MAKYTSLHLPVATLNQITSFLHKVFEKAPQIWNDIIDVESLSYINL